ncbi:MAG: nucleotidyltransferase domain-containing protein [Desulfurococcales archaeon]|jgi:predicted nucleotidyltransferase
MNGYRDRYYRELRKYVEEWEQNFRIFIEEVCKSGVIKSMLLVGSRARGDHRYSSDFDVVAVIKNSDDPLEIAAVLRSLVRGRFPLDLIAIHESEVEDPLYKEMLKTSIDLCSEWRDDT